jgi:organic radical activating enzyme
MSKIKISELFYSIQGEGRYMGVPSVFLRTFGCNFTCSGFGMPKGKLSDERDKIAVEINKFNTYQDLPLVHTGCDSYASWDPRFKHLSPVLSIDAIIDAIIDLLPYKKWQEEHLVITGGEPFLGWQNSYPELLDDPRMNTLQELTFETNGTQFLSDNFINYILYFWQKEKAPDQLTFSVSPKLSRSGEKWEDAIKPEIINQYEGLGYTYLKFVISSSEDVEEASDAVNTYRKNGFQGPVYLMPCGGTEQQYYLNNKLVVKYAMKNGWRYSDRLQIPLFKNAWGT